jgi:alpha-glucosidase (family GH31 glycosyl hydrolase)
MLLALISLVAVPETSPAGVPPVIEVDVRPARVRVSTAAVRVAVKRRRLRLRVRDLEERRFVLREVNKGGLFYERGGTTFALGEVTDVEALADGVRLTVETTESVDATVTLRFRTERALEIELIPPNPETVEGAGERLRSPKRELIYGMTERLRDSPPFLPGVSEIPLDDIQPPEVGSLNRRGETVEMRILPTFSLYAPFYQTSRGYGLAVAGTTFGIFDLASSDHRTVSFRFAFGTTPASQRLQFHVFVSHDYLRILDEYTALTGRPFVPPDWAFKNWRWQGELRSGLAPVAVDGIPMNADFADDILRFDEFSIPPGVYLFDRPVLVGSYGFDRWVWDDTRLPNVPQMLAALDARGYRRGIWSSTWVCGTDPTSHGAEALALGYLAPVSPASRAGIHECSDLGGEFILDLTNADAVAWWRDKIAAFVSAHDLRVIKLDRGEEHIASEADDVWFDGRRGPEVRNAYPILQAKLHHDALAQAFPDGEFLVLMRPGYTGAQQFGIAWGGDIPGSEIFGAGGGTDLGLRSAIISQQRAAFMGYPIWGSDTGGYYEFKDRDVFARWIEFSAFSGLMEVGGVGRHAPWDMPTDPNFDPEMIEIYRSYAQLRETLLPYITAAAADAANGVPLVRPMTFFDRHDRKLSDLWDQYMFGPDLMVAPVWRSGARSRQVYFPKGTWRSYWDPTEVVKGRRTVSVDVPLDRIPVYVREGASVPGP